MFNILDISAAGMDAQRARLEVAATNIANSQTTAAPGTPVYQPLTVVLRSATSGTDALPRPVVGKTTALDVAPRMVYDPGHPDADSRGFVTLPGVDPITSMLDLMSISRGYEANLRAFDVTRSLLQRTLDIGSRR